MQDQKVLSRLDELLAPAVVPVLTVARVGDALPLARALADGGLTTLEITLRTPAAISAIRAINEAMPEVAVGAGTVRSPEQAQSRDRRRRQVHRFTWDDTAPDRGGTTLARSVSSRCGNCIGSHGSGRHGLRHPQVLSRRAGSGGIAALKATGRTIVGHPVLPDRWYRSRQCGFVSFTRKRRLRWRIMGRAGASPGGGVGPDHCIGARHRYLRD